MVTIEQRKRALMSDQLRERLLKAARWMEKKPFRDGGLFQQAADRIAILESALREIYDHHGVVPNDVLNIARNALEANS